MTYNVFSGTLNPTQSISQSLLWQSAGAELHGRRHKTWDET